MEAQFATFHKTAMDNGAVQCSHVDNILVKWMGNGKGTTATTTWPSYLSAWIMFDLPFLSHCLLRHHLLADAHPRWLLGLGGPCTKFRWLVSDPPLHISSSLCGSSFCGWFRVVALHHLALSASCTCSPLCFLYPLSFSSYWLFSLNFCKFSFSIFYNVCFSVLLKSHYLLFAIFLCHTALVKINEISTVSSESILRSAQYVTFIHSALVICIT